MNASFVIFGAIISEALVEYANMLVKDKKLDWHVIACMIIGVGVALAFHVDMFELAGVPATVPYVGVVLTGILLSRGGNFIHDILKRLGVKQSAPADTLGDDPAAIHEAHEING